ncbi:MAG: hypothetical protein K2X91_03030, partial [Thermoleophilia bacterium]|nr:hypothetical protein [Acetobacteraceae bacterium]MBY0395430.1 hypothetical protein [Thermoleophilia bacterium]
ASADSLREAYRSDFVASRARDREINAQLTEYGMEPTATTGATYGHGYLGAVIQMAKEQGLDTAVIRGLAEHGGGDQVVALTPGRVRSFYSPDQVLYSGGRSAGPAAAAALALPGEAGATSTNAQEKPMSAGALPGFGLIPNAGPDDLRRLLRLMPFDPSQGVPITDAGGTPGAEEPRGLQGQIPRAPSPSGGLLDMADLTGPAGAQIHHPGTAKPGGLQSAIAMDEADTQRLEQQTGMMPPAPATGGLLSELFGKAPMGAPQSFTGTSGTVMPGQGPDLSGSPMPPARPSAADLAASAPAARPLGFGSLAPPRPARPQQADMPTPGAVPVAGQVPQAAPATPGAGPTPVPPAAPAAPGGVPPGTPGAEEPSFLDKVGSGLRRFGEAGGGDLLSSIGMGLMSTPGFGQGLAAGLKNYQGVSERKEARDLAKQEFGLRIQKAAQEATGLKGNQAFIKMAFPSLTPEQVVAGASNSTLVSAAIAKMQNPNAGREMKADSSGVNRWVDTGQPVFKDDEGKADWQQVSLPDGGTMLYSKSDPSKTQVVVQGQPVRHATAEERAAYGIQPGQGVKITPKEGPVPVGGVAQPHVREFEQPDGSKIARVQNPETGAWEAPNFGARPPATQAPSNPYATGKFNEGQGKAAGFTDRMMGSEPILRDLEGVKQGMLRGTAEGFLPNGWKTEDRQKLEQAQRDFINAQLRRESGAAISPSEFANAEKQYFPQPGDTDAVVSQKRANRQRAIEAMGRESGPAYAPSKKFDEKGGIVPSMTPDSRFKQLRGAGLSKEDAYARMHTEGY